MPPIPADQISPYVHMLGAKAVAIRYGVVIRTIDRWVEAGVLPQPSRVILNRRYWALADLERHDREMTVKAGAAA
jgi:hypothetical protein